MADYSYLDPVINALEDAFEEHESTLMEFIGKMGKSLYPMTYFALMSFIPKIESLRIGIFNLVEIDEYYSEKILFRCCCEHFLNFKYIFIRLINKKIYIGTLRSARNSTEIVFSRYNTRQSLL